MGVLPLQFKDGESALTHGLDGSEVIDVTGLDDGASRTATVVAKKADGSEKRFEVDVLLLTPKEVEYYRNGGILHYVLRDLAKKAA
jgi:aconitate hydratase